MAFGEGTQTGRSSLDLPGEQGFEQCRQVGRIVFEIRVLDGDKVAPGLLEGGADGGALAAVDLVVQGAQAAPVSEPAEWVAYAAALIDDGASTRDAVTQTAADFDVPRRSVYEAVTGSRGTSPA